MMELEVIYSLKVHKLLNSTLIWVGGNFHPVVFALTTRK